MIVPAGSSLERVREICAQVAAQGGGRVDLEAGSYEWPDETFDLSVYGGGITFGGPNIRATTILTATTNKPAILAATPASSFNVLHDFGIRGAALTMPTVRRPDNHAICNLAGTGYGLTITSVEVMYLGDTPIKICGATGPTKVVDCSLQLSSSWGLEILDGTQNVNVFGGNLQYCWGGVHVRSGFTGRIQDIDIELGDAARWAPLWFEGFVGAYVVSNATLQAAPPTGQLEQGGLVVLTGDCIGNTFEGGIFRADTGRFPNVLLRDHGVANNIFAAGTYIGAGTRASGELIVVDQARWNKITLPGPTDTYAPGRQVIRNVLGPDNHTIVESWVPVVIGKAAA